MLREVSLIVRSPDIVDPISSAYTPKYGYFTQFIMDSCAHNHLFIAANAGTSGSLAAAINRAPVPRLITPVVVIPRPSPTYGVEPAISLLIVIKIYKIIFNIIKASQASPKPAASSRPTYHNASTEIDYVEGSFVAKRWVDKGDVIRGIFAARRECGKDGPSDANFIPGLNYGVEAKGDNLHFSRATNTFFYISAGGTYSVRLDNRPDTNRYLGKGEGGLREYTNVKHSLPYSSNTRIPYVHNYCCPTFRVNPDDLKSLYRGDIVNTHLKYYPYGSGSTNKS